MVSLSCFFIVHKPCRWFYEAFWRSLAGKVQANGGETQVITIIFKHNTTRSSYKEVAIIGLQERKGCTSL
jgi:hypothetical protein